MEAIRIAMLAPLDMHSRRSMLEGFHSIALGKGWAVFRSSVRENLEGYLSDCDPAAVVVCPDATKGEIPSAFRSRVLLSLFADRTAEGVASMLEDNAAIGRVAAEHLLETGIQCFASFSYALEPWATERMAGFRERIVAAGRTYDAGGEFSSDQSHPNRCSHPRLAQWLSGLPKPCGIFACCDAWARGLALQCGRRRLRIPEDIALVGADNDHLQCELCSPPISSVDTPWYEMGRHAATLLDAALKAGSLPARLVRVAPTGVVARRSSDIAAVDDPEVAEAVAWIRGHGHLPLMVTDVLRAVPVYRRRLERRFRAVLGRSILEEIRRSHVEIAKRLLTQTDLSMEQIAARSGYTNATLMGVAFKRETGMTPSRYRRRTQERHARGALSVPADVGGLEI